MPRLVQAATLSLLFGDTGKPAKPGRLFDKKRPILWRVAQVSRSLLIDFCKAAMLIGGHEHGGPSSLPDRAGHNGASRVDDQGCSQLRPQLSGSIKVTGAAAPNLAGWPQLRGQS